MEVGEVRYYRGIFHWSYWIILVFLVMTSIIFLFVNIIGFIIPLVFIVVILISNFMKIKINKFGNVCIPGIGNYGKFPINSYMVNRASFGGPRRLGIGITFYFNMSNIKEIYQVSDEKEKKELIGMKPFAERVRTNNISNINKTICIKFKSPLSYFKYSNSSLDANSSIDKMYLSLANPQKFVDDINNLKKTYS